METQSTAIALYPEALTYAHSHDFYTINFYIKGEGSVTIDFNEYEVKPQSIFFIPPGQLHKLNNLKNFNGVNISFTEDFLQNMSNHAHNIIIHRLFPNRNQASICYIKNEDLNRIVKDYENLQYRYENPTDSNIQNDYLASLLSIFFFDILEYGVWEHAGDNIKDPAAFQVYLDFISILDRNFTRIHAAEDYANLMPVTLNVLNKSVSKTTGKTAYNLINERLVLEAKRMLFEKAEMRIKEIAHALGFSDNSNFVKFFKRHVGMSPIEFRENL